MWFLQWLFCGPPVKHYFDPEQLQQSIDDETSVDDNGRQMSELLLDYHSPEDRDSDEDADGDGDGESVNLSLAQVSRVFSSRVEDLATSVSRVNPPNTHLSLLAEALVSSSGKLTVASKHRVFKNYDREWFIMGVLGNLSLINSCIEILDDAAKTNQLREEATTNLLRSMSDVCSKVDFQIKEHDENPRLKRMGVERWSLILSSFSMLLGFVFSILGAVSYWGEANGISKTSGEIMLECAFGLFVTSIPLFILSSLKEIKQQWQYLKFIDESPDEFTQSV